jgi:O-antigen/teichoic acid export membrane protein
LINNLKYIFESGAPPALSIIVISYIAFNFGVSAIGAISLTLTVATLIVPVLLLGSSHTIFIRAASKRTKITSYRYMMGNTLLVSGITFIIATAVLYFCFDSKGIIYLCFLRVLFTFGEIFRTFIRGSGEIAAAYNARLYGVFFALTYFITCILLNLSMASLAFAIVLETAVSTIFLYINNPVKPKFSLKHLFLHMLARRFLIIQAISIPIYSRMDQFVLSYVAVPAHFGIYALASRYAEAIIFLYNIFMLKLTPKIIKEAQVIFDFSDITRLIIGVCGSIIFIQFITYSLMPIAVLIFGSSTQLIINIFNIYLLCAIFTTLGFLGSNLAVYYEQHKRIAYSATLGVFSSLIIMLNLSASHSLEIFASSRVIVFSITCMPLFLMPRKLRK